MDTGVFRTLLNKIQDKFSFLVYCLSTIPRDAYGLYVLIRVYIDLWYFYLHKMTVGDMVKCLASRHPDKPCFIMENRVFTFRDVEKTADRVHKYFQNNMDVRHGDVIALLMENRPEYPCIWVGLSRLGLSTALINTNLKGDMLAQALKTCQCKYLLYSESYEKEVHMLQSKMECEAFLLDLHDGTNTIRTEAGPTIDINQADELGPAKSLEYVNYNDVLLYIFTSGTTGLPKAAKIRHNRFLLGTCGCYRGMIVHEDDVIYNCLPLYHAMGGWLCLAYALIYGNTIVLKKKFSVHDFWRDCVIYNCTFFVYIGEFCRYLINGPPSPYEKLHSIRSGSGNGLRKEVWNRFLQRFGPIRMVEFYASTEGNAYFFNMEGIPGPCGFNSIIAPCFLPSRVIQFDSCTNEPMRGHDGLCIECKAGEPGILISPITKSVWQRFDGYKNASDTAKKVISNVFSRNDIFFQTGDVMMADEYGYIHFVDRAGDTFRWCGENVATFEVEDMLMKILTNADVIVFGVTVSGYEGRAGLAAISITDEHEPDMTEFSKTICQKLPLYSRPVFLRFCQNIQKTSTFKMMKQDLKAEGITENVLAANDDSFFYFDKTQQLYSQLNVPVYQKIVDGSIRI